MALHLLRFLLQEGEFCTLFNTFCTCVQCVCKVNTHFLFLQKRSPPIVTLVQRHLVQYNIHADYLLIMEAFADPEQFLRSKATHVDGPLVHLFFSEGKVHVV